ncbi:MAG TPA: hypothetical protein VFA07_00615 [Chthonomonadaceae bacterium]|nr:hypothetical protein [Chthonomonadaceae bacterium]
MQTRRNKYRVVGTCLLIGIAGALVWRFLPRERLLLKRATRITPVSSPNFFAISSSIPWVAKQTGRKLVVYDPYFWLSDQKVVFLHAVRLSNGEAISLDTRTGVKTLLPVSDEMESWLDSLSIAIGGEHRLNTQVGGDYAVSPDARWLLCSAQGLRSRVKGQTGYMALAMDGTRRLNWPQAGIPSIPDSFPVWLPDHRHWVSAERKPEGDFLLLQSLNAPGKTLRIALPGHLDGPALGVTKAGAILIGSDASSRKGTIDMVEIMLPPTSVSAGQVLTAQKRPLSVAAPPLDNMHITEDPNPIVSPQGDRLAWLVTGEYIPSRLPWLQRLFGFFGVHRQMMVGLWVSGVDGGDMQEIGHLFFKQNEEIPQHLRWTPDGKRLSFLYRSILYTIPAD